MVDDATHQADQVKFDDTETIADGLGPIYNAQSCRECHQNPTSGGTSQVAELRVGHEGADHVFQNPDIPIAHGTEVIKGRTLVNDRSICPSGAFPDTEIQEHVPDSENIRTTRMSLGLLGDGFVEAVADETLVELARKQCDGVPSAKSADRRFLYLSSRRPERPALAASAGRTSTPACCHSLEMPT